MGEFADGYNLAEKIMALQTDNEKNKLMLQQIYIVIQHNLDIKKIEEPKEVKQ
jgi:hypothetical protein